jgi:cytochrome c oxidase accessory protein FixG
LIIQYAVERGEPRGKHKKGETWEGRGHCVDCEACVVVCPMGIDIRNGLQYQCISCGLCIDACNQIMDKLELPRGLVHYDTEVNQERRAQQIARGEKPSKGKMKWIRPRSVYYVIILSIISALMGGAIVMRKETELNVIHNRSPLFVKLSDGTIRNNYQVKVLNKSHDDKSYSVTLKGLKYKSLVLLGAGDEVVDVLKVPANAVGEFRIMVITEGADRPRNDVEFVITDVSNGKTAQHKSYFVEN